MLISLGNVAAHTFMFNLRGKSFYNPGMLTADILFLPIAVYFLVSSFETIWRPSLNGYWVLDWGSYSTMWGS